jgi:titin
VTLAGAVALFAACDQDPTSPARRQAHAPLHDVAPPANVEFFIDAAPQDWQLFMGNVTVASLQTGHKVVIVHTTAGDGGQESPAFWQARERAALASADAVIPAGTWACGPQTVNAHTVRRCAKGSVVAYFMRMPDGNSVDGQGYGSGSLSRLRDLGALTSAIDHSASYGSWIDFTTTVHAIVTVEAPGQVPSAIELHAPEYDRTINPGDHPDNWVTADAVKAAIQGTGWTGAWYVGFHTSSLPPNLSATATAAKQQVWAAYDNVMVGAGYPSQLNDPDMKAWIQRTYSRITATAPGIPSGLAATPVGKNRITLRWTDNTADENGFYVERAPNVGGVAGAFVQIGTSDANVTSYTDATVSPSTAYFYQVRAFSDGGVSPYSNVASGTTPATNPVPYRGDAYVVAHEDDWQIFAGEQAYASLQNALATVFVYVTAGDGGQDSPYWRAREQASLASIDAVIGSGAWLCGPSTVGSHSVYRCSKGSVSAYFLRLPDGNNIDGMGYGYGSILRLRDQQMATSARDGSTAYNSWSDLATTIGQLIGTELSNQDAPYVNVYTQENVIALDPGDHSDHNLTGELVTQAAASRHWDVHQYVGYDTQHRPINLTDVQHAQKMVEFNAYNATMVNLGYDSDAGYPEYQAWLQRTYGRLVLPPSPSLTGPTNTAAHVISSSEIDLTWTDNSPDESGFLIERAPDAAGVPGAFTQIDSVGPNVTSDASTGLALGATYWYRIRAVNSTGVSGYDEPVSATTLAPPPTATPSTLAAQIVSATEIDLSWAYNEAGPLLGYRVERAPDVSGVPGTFAEIATVATGTKTYADTTLTELTTYWYRVRAYNSGGASGYSSAVHAKTLTGLPAAPSGLRATTLSKTSIALDWTDNSNNELGFQLEQAPDAGGAPGTFEWIAGVGANTTTLTVSGLAVGTTYWFRVRSTYIDSSAYSNSASATTFPLPPAAPASFTATAVSGSEIDLAWADVPDEAGYTLQRAPDNNGVPGAYATIATLATGTTTYKNAPLAANTTYWFRIRATNAGGSSAYVVTSATTLTAPPPAPTGLAAKPTTNATTATLTWTDNAADETGYRIEMAPDVAGAAGAYTEIAAVGVNAKTYTATGLTGATKYWFRVRAYGTNGTSGYTNEASMITPLPTNLAVTATGTGGLTASLAWTAGVGAKVDVYRDGVKIKSAITNTGATTDLNRTAGATNVYKVCNAGFSDPANCSNTVSMTF